MDPEDAPDFLPWHIERQGPYEYAFFISHVAEDSQDVARLKNEITKHSSRGGRPPLDCFLDLVNWPIGNKISSVIREYLFKSAYFVLGITPSYLDQARRGWVWLEYAYAELIQTSLEADYPEAPRPYITSIFRNVAIEDIARTPLLDYWQQALITPPGRKCSIPEAARALVEFHEQQARRLGRNAPRSNPAD